MGPRFAPRTLKTHFKITLTNQNQFSYMFLCFYFRVSHVDTVSMHYKDQMSALKIPDALHHLRDFSNRAHIVVEIRINVVMFSVEL